MVNSTTPPASTAATGKTVYVLGGTSAVPASVATQLTALGDVVVRYGGATRYATAVAVADALGDPSTVLLATGENFPDALSGDAFLAHLGAPLVLADTNALPANTASYLQSVAGSVTAADLFGGSAVLRADRSRRSDQLTAVRPSRGLQRWQERPLRT